MPQEYWQEKRVQSAPFNECVEKEEAHMWEQEGISLFTSVWNCWNNQLKSKNTSCILKRQRNQRSNWRHPLAHRKSKTIPEKTSISASLITLKPLTVWITQTVENSSKDGNTTPPYLSPEKPVCRSRSNRTEHGQLTDSKLGKWKWSRSVMSDSLRPNELQPTRLLRPWDFPGKSTRVGCHFLLQGIFLTQESNPGLLHCRQTL